MESPAGGKIEGLQQYILQYIQANILKSDGSLLLPPYVDSDDNDGESTTEPVDAVPQVSKLARKRRRECTITNNNTPDYVHHNNNNHVKNERLSPSTPDVSSRSRSITPSSHPDTPPATDHPLGAGRNYSDFMRSLAAKYNNTNPNDYFSRNGFPANTLDARFKAGAFPPGLLASSAKDTEGNKKATDFSSLINPFANTSMFPPLIDMSATQTLLAMVRSAKEAELQGLLKTSKGRQDSSSPLDLSSAAPLKRPRVVKSSRGSPGGKARALSESPRLHEDVSHWTVDDVSNFVTGIDICAEYAKTFRDQRIDGSGLPLLTEEHLTNTMNMKLGPALKLRSMLAKKLGSCSVCLHCTHCHTGSGSPEPATLTGNTSDSGGAS